MYALAAEERITNFSLFYLANNLYIPSYISCESALEHYGLIPEGVYSPTSVSSKKTQTFNNVFGKFIYHHVKIDLFCDYIEELDEFGKKYFIATKEKALIDFFYLQMPKLKKIDVDIFELSYRLQNLETLNIKKLLTLAKRINKSKLTNIVNLLIKHIEKKT